MSETEPIIKAIAQRIKDEHRKHPNLEWEELAAKKIYESHVIDAKEIIYNLLKSLQQKNDDITYCEQYYSKTHFIAEVVRANQWEENGETKTEYKESGWYHEIQLRNIAGDIIHKSGLYHPQSEIRTYYNCRTYIAHPHSKEVFVLFDPKYVPLTPIK